MVFSTHQLALAFRFGHQPCMMTRFCDMLTSQQGLRCAFMLRCCLDLSCAVAFRCCVGLCRDSGSLTS
jgi:hypothetical protein